MDSIFELRKTSRGKSPTELEKSQRTELEQLRIAKAQEAQAAQAQNQRLRAQLRSAEAAAQAAQAENQTLRQQLQSAQAAASSGTGSSPPPPSSVVDVRQEGWYGHYRHTVFQNIDNAFVQACTKVVLLGIKPPKEFELTNEEFPCLLQDLRDAFMEKKSPFYTADGKEMASFTSINNMRETLVDLPETLKFFSGGDRQVSVLSCAAPFFEGARDAIQQHNRTAKAAGLNTVVLAWATGNDVYGGKAKRDR